MHPRNQWKTQEHELSSRYMPVENSKMKRITRTRHLTKEEAAKVNYVREQIEQEKPEINARIKKKLNRRKKR